MPNWFDGTVFEDILPIDFTAEADETWLDYISSLMAYSKYYYMLDEMGRVLFAPSQSIGSLQSVWTYDDDNSSILYPDIYDDFDPLRFKRMMETFERLKADIKRLAKVTYVQGDLFDFLGGEG